MASSIMKSSWICLELIVLLLIMGDLQLAWSVTESSGLEPYEPNTAAEFYYQVSGIQQEQAPAATSGSAGLAEYYQQQRRKSDFQDTNLKRYLFKEVDNEGYAINSPADHRHLIKLGELLESINAKPIYRNGRGYQNVVLDSSPPSRTQAVQLQSSGSGRALLGLSWPPNRADPGLLTSVSTGSYPIRTKNQHQLRHAALSNNQLSLNGPSNTMSDYEWKRVENTRWNNLRGMWGKRSQGAINVNSNRWLPVTEETADDKQTARIEVDQKVEASRGIDSPTQQQQ